jgi:hypothetical protein
MSKRRKYLAVALLLVAIAGSVAFAFAAIGRSAAFPFRSVTPAELARGGVKVSAATPPANLPITAAQAAATARKFQGRSTLEVRYVRCVDATKVPKLDQDCWAVSIDPHGLTALGGPAVTLNGKTRPPSKIRYDLVFIDADTGKVIEGSLGS